jgi:hypothetical protein
VRVDPPNSDGHARTGITRSDMHISDYGMCSCELVRPSPEAAAPCRGPERCSSCCWPRFCMCSAARTVRGRPRPCASTPSRRRRPSAAHSSRVTGIRRPRQDRAHPRTTTTPTAAPRTSRPYSRRATPVRPDRPSLTSCRPSSAGPHRPSHRRHIATPPPSPPPSPRDTRRLSWACGGPDRHLAVPGTTRAHGDRSTPPPFPPIGRLPDTAPVAGEARHEPPHPYRPVDA